MYSVGRQSVSPPPMHHGLGHAEGLSRLTHRQLERLFILLVTDPTAMSPKALPIGFGSGDASLHSLGDSGAFKFSNCRQDVELQLSSWRGGVYTLGQTDERDTHRLEVVQK